MPSILADTLVLITTQNFFRVLKSQVALLQNQSEYYWAVQEGAIPIGILKLFPNIVETIVLD